MKIEVANGEIVDKLTILSIKLEKIADQRKRANIQKEYDHLLMALESLGVAEDDPDLQALKAVNLTLWQIEDDIREKESKKQFDHEFIELARSVYIQNDRRAELKRRINQNTGSTFCEEKSYAEY